MQLPKPIEKETEAFLKKAYATFYHEEEPVVPLWARLVAYNRGNFSHCVLAFDYLGHLTYYALLISFQQLVEVHMLLLTRKPEPFFTIEQINSHAPGDVFWSDFPRFDFTVSIHALSRGPWSGRIMHGGLDVRGRSPQTMTRLSSGFKAREAQANQIETYSTSSDSHL